jgi:hypothetical protein
MLAVSEHCGIYAGSDLPLPVAFIKGLTFQDITLLRLIYWTQVFSPECIDAILNDCVCYLLV